MHVLILCGVAVVAALLVAGWLLRAVRPGHGASRAISPWMVVAATVAAVGAAVTVTLVAVREDTDRTTPGNAAGAAATSAAPRIETSTDLYFGRPHETIHIPGRYTGVRGPRELRVEVRHGSRWVQFPLPVVTQRSGRFRAYVYLGRTGTYQVRIVDPEERRRSRPLVLELF